MGSHLTATGRHLPYEITRCYLLPDTSERASSGTLVCQFFLLFGFCSTGLLTWNYWRLAWITSMF